jgi:hypothetical protein
MSRFVGELATDVYGVNVDEAKLAHVALTAAQAVAADDDGVHAAITGASDAATTVTDDITDPPYPRNITVKVGGTSASIADGDVVVTGTNYKDEVISETFTCTADTAETLTGSYAFKTVTSILVPQQDGAGATFKIGFGDKLGLPYMLAKKPLVMALLDGAIETTAATVVADADEIEKNTADLNSALNGKAVDLYFAL